jgi:hypothetical protein
VNRAFVTVVIRFISSRKKLTSDLHCHDSVITRIIEANIVPRLGYARNDRFSYGSVPDAVLSGNHG